MQMAYSHRSRNIKFGVYLITKIHILAGQNTSLHE